MTTFVRGRTITMAEPTVTVDAGLAVGVHRFQLVVVTADGRRSAADVVDVSVERLLVDPLRPVLVTPTRIDPVITTTTVSPIVSPTVTTTISPTRVGTTRIRKPRAARADAAPEPPKVPEPPAAPTSRKGRSKRRSES
jgi:hypothetical protein